MWIGLKSVDRECGSVHEVWIVCVDRFDKCAYFFATISRYCGRMYSNTHNSESKKILRVGFGSGVGPGGRGGVDA